MLISKLPYLKSIANVSHPLMQASTLLMCVLTALNMFSIAPASPKVLCCISI